MERQIIRIDGTREMLTERVSIAQIEAMIGAQVLDTVTLRHLGHPLHVMCVDDLGHQKGLPVNEKATSLYHASCLPGTMHQIRGDVVVVPDSDFGV